MTQARQTRSHATDPAGAAELVSRRGMLKGLAGSSALIGLAGCSGLTFGDDELPPIGTVGKAAFLVPLTGPRASIGQIMASAASLGGKSTDLNAEVAVIDSGNSNASAVAAAQTAIDSGAKMLIGPLFSGQSTAVAQAVGRKIPVVSLSNNQSIADRNLFVFGITPRQSAQTVLRFAAARGSRRIAVVAPPGDFSELSVSAAQAVAKEAGITMPPPVFTNSASGLVGLVRAAAGGRLPDAVYLPTVGGAFKAQAKALKEAGVQLLGSNQWASLTPYQIPALIGGWYAAPDPVRFEAFVAAVEQELGQTASVVSALSFDAVEMARILGRLDKQSRKGLLREAGFDGVLGPYRFRSDGQCERSLAVLSVVQGATTLVGAAAG